MVRLSIGEIIVLIIMLCLIAWCVTVFVKECILAHETAKCKEDHRIFWEDIEDGVIVYSKCRRCGMEHGKI